MKPMLLNGYEIRRVRGTDLAVYHCQDMSWRQFTFLRKEDPSVEGVGKFYLVNEVEMKEMKRFFPWRTQEAGMGPVRGHAVTFSPKYGAQAWVMMEMRLREGRKNLPCLVGQQDVRIRSKEDFHGLWQKAMKWLKEEYPMGLHSFIEFDTSINRHRVEGPKYKFLNEPVPAPEPAPSEPAVDTASSGVVPESPAG